MYAIKQPKKGRHHNSKHYKKHDTSVKNCLINTENPDEKGMKAIKEMCRMWWNGISNPKHIKNIMIELDKCDTDKQKENVLKPIYYEIANRSPIFKRDVKRSLFSYNFILGAPYFKKWIAEEERSEKTNITGKLEIEILNLFISNNGLSKSKNIETIYNNINNFESVIDGVLTRLNNKGAIKLKTINNKRFVVLNESLKVDKKGFYIN